VEGGGGEMHHEIQKSSEDEFHMHEKLASDETLKKTSSSTFQRPFPFKDKVILPPKQKNTLLATDTTRVSRVEQ